MTDLQSTDRDPGSPEDHTYLESCALYLMGGLGADDEQAFERHLGSCLICMDECDRLGPLVTAFGDLTAEEAAELRADLTGHPATTGTAGATTPGEPGWSGRRARGSRPPRAARGMRHTPAGRRRLAMVSLAVVAAVSFTVAITLAPDGPEQTTVEARPVAATAEGVVGKARLSAVVTAVAGQRSLMLKVEATVSGLTAGTVYRLYAVTGTGETRQVAEWTAGSETDDVSGEVAATLDELAFFSVTRQDGSAVVSARIARPAPTR